MRPARRHHVVVGGSAAGVAAALAMRAHGADGLITIVDAGADLPYERPPLSKAPADVVVPRPIVPTAVYAEHGIELRLATRVTGLDASRRTVALAGGESLPADRVLLATGVRPRTLDIPGHDLANVLALRDVADARALSERLAAGGPLVLLGAGFIGLEVAAVARQRGLPVTVVEVAPLPLGAVLGRRPAQLVSTLHRENGVRIATGRHAVALLGNRAVEAVALDDGQRIEAATVVVGCGVVPNDDLARQAGAEVDGGIVVDAHGRTTVPWVYAAGDVATSVHPHTGRRQRIEHWDVARRAGAAVGATMAGVPTVNAELPYFWSEQYGRLLQMYGRPAPTDRLVLRAAAPTGSYLAFWVRGGTRVVAVAGLDAGRELRAAKALIDRRVGVDPAALADPAVGVRSLLPSAAGAA